MGRMAARPDRAAAGRGMAMGELRADAVGPVDVAVITFDGGEFTGDIAEALVDLQASGTVRLIDLAFVRKDASGSVSRAEVADKDIAAQYARIGDPRFELVSQTDLEGLASALRPGSAAMVVAWENSWTARLTAAVSAANGHVVAFDRIPFEAVQRALAETEDRGGPDGSRPAASRQHDDH